MIRNDLSSNDLVLRPRPSVSNNAEMNSRKFLRKSFNYLTTIVFSTRLLIAALGIFSHYYIGRYDTSNDLLHNAGILHCPSNWDGAYFTHIIQHGYTNEQMHAFFPFYPIVVRLYYSMIKPVLSIFIYDFGLNEADKFAFFSSLVSGICFFHSTMMLAMLCERLVDDRAVALRAAILYCFNPASIFFVVAYSESLYALLSFSGMYLLTTPKPEDEDDDDDDDENDGNSASSSYRARPKDCYCIRASLKDFAGYIPSVKKRVLASLVFSLATLTRAQGTLLCIFSLYVAIRAYVAEGKIVLKEFERSRMKKYDGNENGKSKVVVTPPPLTAYERYKRGCLLFALTIRHGFILLIIAVIHALPLGLYLFYGYNQYCNTDDPTEARSWCNSWKPFPNIYAFVQSHYWNVGFLRYYEAKQIPNFLLAAPIILLSKFTIYSLLPFGPSFDPLSFHVSSPAPAINTAAPSTSNPNNGISSKSNTLSPAKLIQRPPLEKQTSGDGPAFIPPVIRKTTSIRNRLQMPPVVYIKLLPYLLHMTIMLVFAITTMHIQVTTRFICASCPPLYIYAALSTKQKHPISYLILVYFVVYMTLGAMMFCSFYPWT